MDHASPRYSRPLVSCVLSFFTVSDAILVSTKDPEPLQVDTATQVQGGDASQTTRMLEESRPDEDINEEVVHDLL